jgi:hypothetical protein
MNIKRFITFASIACASVGFGASAEDFTCEIVAHGTEPAAKTYYLEATDPGTQMSLEFAQHSYYLKSYLDKAGYREVPKENADLRIVFSYSVLKPGNMPKPGEKPAEGVKPEGPEGMTPGDCELTFGNHKEKRRDSNGGGFGGPGMGGPGGGMGGPGGGMPPQGGMGGPGGGQMPSGRPEGAAFKIPGIVVIEAFQAESKEPVWKVTCGDEMEKEDQFDAVMPWLLVCATQYAGTDTNGQKSIKLKNNKSNRKEYDLVWPY